MNKHLLFSISKIKIKQSNKTKIWTLPILTTSLTDLINKFAKSDFEKISDFFNFFIQQKFGNDLQAKKKYLRTVFISLLFFSRQNYSIAKFYELFQQHETHEMYDFYNETRLAALSMQNLNIVTFVDMEQVFLNVQERTYILHQIFGFKKEQQNSFDKLINEEFKKSKTKNLKIKKNDEISLPFFLHCCMIQFQQLQTPEQQQQEIKKIKTRLTILSQNVPKRDTGLLQKMTLMMKKGLLNDVPQEDIEDLKEDIQSVNEQIKEQKIKKFQYKDSSIQFMSILKALDNFVGEIKVTMDEKFKELLEIKKKLPEETQNNLDNDLNTQFKERLYEGSEISSDSSRKLLKKILNLHPHFYKELDKRIKENYPKNKAKITKIKKKILQELLQLGSRDEFTQFELKTQLEQYLDNKQPKNEDYDVLQAIVYGRTLNYDKACLNTLLDNQCNKIENIINELLADESEDNEEILMENFNTVQNQLGKINDMDEFQFNKYQTETGGDRERQQTKLDRMIQKQIKGLGDQMELQKSEKDIKKRLTQQMFDQYKISNMDAIEEVSFKKDKLPQLIIDNKSDMNEENNQSLEKSERKKSISDSDASEQVEEDELKQTEILNEDQSSKSVSKKIEDVDQVESEQSIHSEKQSDKHEEIDDDKESIISEKIDSDKESVKSEQKSEKHEEIQSDKESVKEEEEIQSDKNEEIESDQNHEMLDEDDDKVDSVKSKEQNIEIEVIDQEQQLNEDQVLQDQKSRRSEEEQEEKLSHTEEDPKELQLDENEDIDENSEDMNKEGTELIESGDEQNILQTETDMNAEDINDQPISMQQKIQEKIIERESQMREQVKPDEGYGRPSYRLLNLIDESRKKIKK